MPLAERMLFTYGDTLKGMVESAMEFVRICDELDFHNIVIDEGRGQDAGRLSPDGGHNG